MEIPTSNCGRACKYQVVHKGGHGIFPAVHLFRSALTATSQLRLDGASDISGRVEVGLVMMVFTHESKKVTVISDGPKYRYAQ